MLSVSFTALSPAPHPGSDIWPRLNKYLTHSLCLCAGSHPLSPTHGHRSTSLPPLSCVIVIPLFTRSFPSAGRYTAISPILKSKAKQTTALGPYPLPVAYPLANFTHCLSPMPDETLHEEKICVCLFMAVSLVPRKCLTHAVGTQ